MTIEMILAISAAAAVLIMLIYLIRRKHPLRSFLFGAATGLAALMLINRFGSLIGICVPLNMLNVTGSSILGVPFVVCIALLIQV